MAIWLSFPSQIQLLQSSFRKQFPARNFVGIFAVLRLEPSDGSCNVYQSVKLSVRCKIKATADFPAQRKQTIAPGIDQGNRPDMLMA
jgi:hypothetical protein